jgi:hypothetical protein
MGGVNWIAVAICGWAGVIDIVGLSFVEVN